jgi:hypothetical protein
MDEWKRSKGAIKGVVIVVDCEMCEGKGYAYDSLGRTDCPTCEAKGEVMLRITLSDLRRYL